MQNISLFKGSNHRFLLLNESEPGVEDGIPSNQYLIIHNEQGFLLDPGGFGVMPRVLTEMLRYLQPEQIRGIVLSHQDPDIVGGLATWMEMTTADIYVSKIWKRFLPHYGLVGMERFIGVEDEGQSIVVENDFSLQLVPAHFLHSPGQINVYDPVAKILFSGDIGAAEVYDDIDQVYVDDFSAHIPYIEKFHKRYMASNRALRYWLEQIEMLEIDMIAPQHGPIYRGEAVKNFLAWLYDLRCGSDLLSLRQG